MDKIIKGSYSNDRKMYELEKWVWMEWAFNRASGFGPVEKRKTLEQFHAYLPMGTYFRVTSQNPFKMMLLED